VDKIKLNIYIRLWLNVFDKEGKSLYNGKANGDIKVRRCMTMKRTYQPNNRKKSKKMGFMARIKSKIVGNRRRKGRKVLSR